MANIITLSNGKRYDIEALARYYEDLAEKKEVEWEATAKAVDGVRMKPEKLQEVSVDIGVAIGMAVAYKKVAEFLRGDSGKPGVG